VTLSPAVRIPLSDGRGLPLGPLPGVMAILNVTPDSFSDGGRFATAAAAIDEGIRAADLGAAVVDVGGESTRPRGATYGEGASEPAGEEEAARAIPIVAALRKARPSLPISIDTRRTEVARRALDAGADLVNVVTGLDVPGDLLALVAERGAGLVLGHCRGTPQTTFQVSQFNDVVSVFVSEVAADLAAARARALAAGVSPATLFVDPGFGFGKNPEQNFALLGALDRLAPPGIPLVVGASRKAFLGAASGRPPGERLPESLAVVAVAVQAAAARPLLVRVHDTEETLRFLDVLKRSARSHRGAIAS
jgi:dihydropteroate synthase